MQGFNMGRYVPPEHEGVVSANKLAGKHPLGSRARHLHSTGALIVRFEMPFPVWCTTCKPPSSATKDKGEGKDGSERDSDYVLIGQGVRFNAEKKKVGNYYSTPIWSFRMRHSVCGGWIEIRTDPKNAEYVVVEGARRKVEPSEKDLWVGEGSVGEIRVRKPSEEGKEGEQDPFAKLETKVRDERGYMTAQERMEELRKRQKRDWEDPYEMSKKLRRAFRAERKAREAAQARADALRDKMSLGIELLEESEADRVRASMVQFGLKDKGEAAVRTRGLFDSTTSGRQIEQGKDHGGKKKRLKKKTTADVVLERKSLLAKELSGNTRAAIDPFLSDEKVWHPDFIVKKKSDTGNGINAASSSTPDANDDKNGSLVVNGKSAQDPPDVSERQQQPPSTALVAYGSDSD
ncbi:hypothetical protein VTO42DRAFT_1387 [Malbranchea cinnamomea]